MEQVEAHLSESLFGRRMANLISKILLLAMLPLGLSLILLIIGLIGRWRWL